MVYDFHEMVVLIFRDRLAALLGIDQNSLMSKRDVYGGLFENMVVMDMLKYFNNQKKVAHYSFFRDTSQKEIDLIIETEGKTIPIEIKASETFNAHFLDTVSWFQEQTKNKEKAALIYGGSALQTIKNVSVFPWYYMGDNNFHL